MPKSFTSFSSSFMKLTNRGFTLVELMIVIAIIGILAAALFPSMTNYLKRSRDAARASHMKDISTALGAYYSDKETYPEALAVVGPDATGCMGSGRLDTVYMPKGVPTDPTTTNLNGCATPAKYGFGSSSGSTAINPTFLLMANLENVNGGNWTGTLTAGMATGQITALPTYVLTKGKGPVYIMTN